MKEGLTMRGMNAVEAMLERLDEQDLLCASSDGVRAGLDAICMEARALCPVDTGALRASISIRMTPDGGEVYADAPYAAQVEVGTMERPAQPFLFPAMRAKEADAVLGVCRAVSRQVKGEG